MNAISLSSLKAGQRFRFARTTLASTVEKNGGIYCYLDSSMVFTVTRNCCQRPNNAPASGYIFFEGSIGVTYRAYGPIAGNVIVVE